MRPLFLFLALNLGSCTPKPARIAPAGERLAIAEELQWFRETWLAPARIAPPTVPRRAVETTNENIRATAQLLLPEEASWNTWDTPGGRLFNNRAAHLFEVVIEGEGLLRWIPTETLLELNTEGNAHRASRSSEDLLMPLFRAAIDEERAVLDGDLVARTRAAGPFRSAYMPSEANGLLRGLIAFPNSTNTLHVVAMRLTVVIEREGRRVPLVWTLD
jgi:hypothetical protein